MGDRQQPPGFGGMVELQMHFIGNYDFNGYRFKAVFGRSDLLSAFDTLNRVVNINIPVKKKIKKPRNFSRFFQLGEIMIAVIEA